MIIYVLMSILLLKMWKNFTNSLLILIIMETAFLLTATNLLLQKSSSMSMIFFVTLMIFMVLESTMGLTILISKSRNSSSVAQMFYKI